MTETEFQDNLTAMREQATTEMRFAAAYPSGYACAPRSIARQVAQDVQFVIANNLDADPTTAY